jgi:hypothetical protein
VCVCVVRRMQAGVAWYLCAAASTACSCAIFCTSADWQAATAAEVAAEEAADEAAVTAAVAAAAAEACPSSSTFSTWLGLRSGLGLAPSPPSPLARSRWWSK